jgi:superfamily II DNA or RNA helicase
MGLIETCRVDQLQALMAWEELFKVHRHVLNVQPTGTGKTHVSAAMMQMRRLAGLSTLFVVHRDILAVQTYDRLKADGLDPGVFTGPTKRNLDSLVVVASVQTVARRHARNPEYLHRFDRIVVDEAHRGEMDKIFALKRPEQEVLGQTASPCRGYGNGLGRFYQHMHLALTYTQALDIKSVVPPQIYAPVKPDMSSVKVVKGTDGESDFKQEPAAAAMGLVTSSGVEFWKEKFGTLRTLAFCVNIKHAMDTEAKMKELGIKCCVITGSTPKETRNLHLAELESGTITVVINVGVFVEGYDAKCIECVLMLAPTASLAKLLQAAGRGSRAAPGKTHYVFVDCSGSVWLHGSPAIDREWSLEFGAQKRSPSSPYRTCGACFSFYSGKTCPLCGVTPEVTVRPVKTGSADMVEISAALQAPVVAPKADDSKPHLNGEELERSMLHSVRVKLYATAPRHMPRMQVQEWVRKKMAERVLVNVAGSNVTIPAMPNLLW